MCGIVGYYGKKNASDILIDCLSKLEYRGYDSSGIAILDNTKDLSLNIRKFKGRLNILADSLKSNPLNGNIGIGHTRWATHGEPSDLNSHPHINNNSTLSVVHNGIIENYTYLKDWLKSKGYLFYSDTDTEVIPKLIDYYYKDDLFKAVVNAIDKLQGSFAIAVISSDEPDKIIAVKKDSPLIVGVGKDEYFIASDIPAVLNYTRDVYLLDDREFVIINKNGIELKNDYGEAIKKDIYHVNWSIDAAEKCGYEDFMLKEIYEQPKSIRTTMGTKISLNSPIVLDNIYFSAEDIKNFDKIFIVACGTAYYAGLVGKYLFETLTNITVETDIASEFRYRNVNVTSKSLVIVVSQSGETADTLAVLRKSKKMNARILAITNVVGSSVAREATDVFYTFAGPEIAVASTKAYISQLTAFYILAIYFAEKLNSTPIDKLTEIKSELLLIPDKASEILADITEIQKYAASHYNQKDIFYLGRGLDYAVALEGSLKLKEISYIHSEAYAGGELKHGPIALIEKGTPVVALLTENFLKEKMLSNVREVITRGGEILAICKKDDTLCTNLCPFTLYIPNTIDLLTPLLSVILLQLLAYYIAKQKGLDVDKPRNLAKSVTVE